MEQLEPNPPHYVLVVSGDPADAGIIRESLGAPGYESFEVAWAGSLSHAFDQLARLQVVVILLDLSLGQGVEAFDAVFSVAPNVPILIMCRLQDEATAKEAVRRGAKDYVPKSQRDSYSLPRAVRSAIAGTIAAEAVRGESQRAEATLNSIGDGVLSTDLSGGITYLNDVAERMTGWSRAEAIGRPLDEVFKIIDAMTRETARDPFNFALEQDQTVGLSGNTLLIRRDGAESAIEDSAAPIRDPGGHVVGAVLVFRDVSETRALALRMSHVAHHDILTGLPNRILLNDRLTQAMYAAPRHGKKLALMFLDIDGFKAVNDTWGHAVGDVLLQSVANRLVAGLRNTDTVSRHGGDEFVILLSEIESAGSAARVAQKLLSALAPVHRVGECEVHITASIGISIYPEHGKDAEVLLHKADTAMYRAKKNHGAKYRFFE